jgi:hypothetical protein
VCVCGCVDIPFLTLPPPQLPNPVAKRTKQCATFHDPRVTITPQRYKHSFGQLPHSAACASTAAANHTASSQPHQHARHWWPHRAHMRLLVGVLHKRGRARLSEPVALQHWHAHRNLHEVLRVLGQGRASTQEHTQPPTHCCLHTNKRAAAAAHLDKS